MATYRAQTSNAGLSRILTPVAGDLFVMLVATSGNTNDTPTCSDNNPSGDGSYHPVGVLRWNASGNRAAIFVRNHLIDNTTNTTVTVNVGTATTVFTALTAYAGMTLAGAAAVRQFGMQENQPATGTAGATVASACLTDNLTLTAVFSNDFSQTPPAGWTERVENGAPPCINVSTRDNGYTGTGENYTATPSTVFAAAFIEFDASEGSPGETLVTPTEAVSASHAISPNVVVGALDVVPAVAVSSSAVTNPSTTLGALQVSPDVAITEATSLGPTISLEAVSVTPAAATAPVAVTDPTATLGILTAVPAIASSITTVVDPAVTFGGYSTVIANAVANASVVDPVVTLGNIEVPLVEAIAFVGAVGLNVRATWFATPLPAVVVAVSADPSVQQLLLITPTPARANVTASYLGSPQRNTRLGVVIGSYSSRASARNTYAAVRLRGVKNGIQQ